MTIFEYDENKSQSNVAKHGIGSVEVQTLRNDSNLLEIPAKNQDGPRFLIVGTIEDNHWSAVITYRGQNIRIISVRRSRIEEVALYES